MNWYKRAQIDGKEPWELTQSEFLNYHNTGFIRSDAYEMYDSVDKLKEKGFVDIDKHPVFYSKGKFGPYTIEFRQSGRDLQYTKTNEEGWPVYDSNGRALMLSKEEMIEKELPLKDTTIVAYHGDDPVGWVANEFGATGVWVVKEFQGLGIGTYLLKEYRKNIKPDRRMGQMTIQGTMLVRKYHKNLVKEALQEGKPVPEEVLKDYPDLVDPNIEPMRIKDRYEWMMERKRDELV